MCIGISVTSSSFCINWIPIILVSLLLGSYGSIVQLLPLTAATFLWPRAIKAGAICGVFTGGTFKYIIVLKVVHKFAGIHLGLQGLLLNILVLVFVSYLTKPMEKYHVRQYVEL